VKVVLASEVYPPRAGGAGWSTRALALALREGGHAVTVVTTSPGTSDLDRLDVRRLVAGGRKRLAVPRAFARALGEMEADVVHAQHPLSALGALAGGPRPVAVTVRDHWPVCFWSTRMSRGALCPGCGTGAMMKCVTGRVPAPGPLAWAAIPYMGLDLALKRRALRRAGATLAVSDAIADELRAAGIPRVEVIPNVVDAEEVRATAAAPPSFPLPERFLLYVGKLEENKGARLLATTVAASRTGLPLVVLGEGSLAHTVKFDAAAAGVPLVLRGWAERDDVLRCLARATALVFPSLWPEPLSRVLLEALALGAPMAAMATGGTRELLGDDGAGLVVDDAAALAGAVARLAGDAGLRARTAEAARARAAAFAPAALLPRYEAVYRRIARRDPPAASP
jgi:glycosyltransferase involved in cell wall biosynthesis